MKTRLKENTRKKVPSKWFMVFVFLLVLLFVWLFSPEKPASTPVHNPPTLEEELPEISPQADPGSSTRLAVPLYFRIQGEEYLARETRTITLSNDRQVAFVLIDALIDGPSASLQDLTSVFHPGTKVLSLSGSGNLLTVTLSSEFLNPPSDAPQNWQEDPTWQHEVLLRRKLALQSVVNAVTEVTSYTSVQFLVQKSPSTDTGSRIALSEIEKEAPYGALLGPMYRSESSLLTHYNTSLLLLECWHLKDFERMYRFVSVSDRPTHDTFVQALSAIPRTLSGYALSAGTVSSNGTHAVLEANLNIQTDGGMVVMQSYPLHLVMESGLWKIEYSDLNRMMEGAW